MCQKKYSRYFTQFLQVIYYLIENLGSSAIQSPYFDIFELLTTHYFSLEKTFPEIPDPEFKHSDILLGYEFEAAQSGKKEEAKGFFWDTSLNYTYLVEAICTSLDPDNSEHIALFNDTDRIDKLILDSSNKIGHKAVSSLFRKIGTRDQNILKQYIERLIMQLGVRDAQELTPILRQFKRIMANVADEVLDLGMTAFCKCLRTNSTFYKATDMSLEVFFKLMCYNEAARGWAQAHQDQWQWMHQWSQDNTTPPGPTNTQVKMYKKATNQTMAQLAARPNTERITILDSLMASEEFRLTNYDSDMDTADIDFQVNDTMWALDMNDKQYMQVRVDSVVDFMMHIKYQDYENMTRWIDKDNEHLIPLNKS